MNDYGQTKLQGERALSNTLENYFIVRITWVLGLNGKGFIKTMIKVEQTYCYDLSRFLVDMCRTDKYSYYNIINEGGISAGMTFVLSCIV